MRAILLCAVALIIVTVVACAKRRNASDEIVVGGLYASKSADGTFMVSKVLAVDESTVHVRIYKNKFPSLPENLDTSALSLGKLGDSGGFGIGHAPIAKEGWLVSQVFLKKEPVRDEELDGYKFYLEEMRKK
jgi:hypothetical protein